MAEPDEPRANPPREQLELIDAELRGRAEAQSAEVEGLDRKASTTLAACGVVLGLVLTNACQFHDAAWAARSLFLGALVALAVGLVAGVGAIWPRRAKIVPAPRRLIEGYYTKSRPDTLAVLISTRLRAFEDNKNVSRSKVLWLRAQMILLACGGIALVLAFAMKEYR
jgi:hypothetical protein